MARAATAAAARTGGLAPGVRLHPALDGEELDRSGESGFAPRQSSLSQPLRAYFLRRSLARPAEHLRFGQPPANSTASNRAGRSCGGISRPFVSAVSAGLAGAAFSRGTPIAARGPGIWSGLFR